MSVLPGAGGYAEAAVMIRYCSPGPPRLGRMLARVHAQQLASGDTGSVCRLAQWLVGIKQQKAGHGAWRLD